VRPPGGYSRSRGAARRDPARHPRAASVVQHEPQSFARRVHRTPAGRRGQLWSTWLRSPGVRGTWLLQPGASPGSASPRALRATRKADRAPRLRVRRSRRVHARCSMGRWGGDCRSASRADPSRSAIGRTPRTRGRRCGGPGEGV